MCLDDASIIGYTEKLNTIMPMIDRFPPTHIILFWEVLCCVDNERKSLPKVHRVPLRCKINSETSSIGNTFLSEY